MSETLRRFDNIRFQCIPVIRYAVSDTVLSAHSMYVKVANLLNTRSGSADIAGMGNTSNAISHHVGNLSSRSRHQDNGFSFIAIVGSDK